MDKIEITNEELNKILIKDFGQRKFISESGRIPLLLKLMAKRLLPLPKSLRQINSLILQGKYQEVYELIHHDRMIDNRSKWYYDSCLIVLCYFRLNKENEAKELIEALSYITNSLPQIILNIAQKVGAKYIPGNMNKSV